MTESGITPFDLKVLVYPDPPEEKTPGGLIKPQQTQTEEKYAATKATLISRGENAFREWGDTANKPEDGQRVLIAKYAGLNIKGDDGKDYRLCNDEDIVARIT